MELDLKAASIGTNLAPLGHLRTSINLGNPILAGRSNNGDLFGVSVDLAKSLAQYLCLQLEMRPFDAAGKAVEALRNGDVDIGFFAIDTQRSRGICFTPPYVLIEGAYLVRSGSELLEISQVDHAANQVVVGEGSAYDLFLSRELKQANIVRAPTSPGVVDMFIAGNYQVAAGVRQQLEADRLRYPKTRLLPESFMVIRQAIGLPESTNSATQEYLSEFIEMMKSNGTVARLLQTHNIEGARVAPAAQSL